MPNFEIYVNFIKEIESRDLKIVCKLKRIKVEEV